MTQPGIKTTVPGLRKDASDPAVFRQTDLTAMAEMKYKRQVMTELEDLRAAVAALTARVAELEGGR